MKKTLMLIVSLLVLIMPLGCFDFKNENNNNQPSYGEKGWQSNGCSLDEWMAFYDENKAYINMSRETWLDKYPGE